MAMAKIDKGIPMPRNAWSQHGVKRGKHPSTIERPIKVAKWTKWPLALLEVGDSFAFDSSVGTIGAVAARFTRKHPARLFHVSCRHLRLCRVL